MLININRKNIVSSPEDQSTMVLQRDKIFDSKAKSPIPTSRKKTQNEQHWTIYRLVRNQTTNAVKQVKKAYYKERAQILTDSKCPPTKWWKTAKELCGLSLTPSSIPPLENETTLQNRPANTYEEKVEVLNNTFIKHGSSLPHPPLQEGPLKIKSIFSFKPLQDREVGR